MRPRYFEEALGTCECSNVSNGGVCVTRQGKIRRVMGIESGTIGVFHCERCMPEFFSNPKQYQVVKALKGKDDPLFDDYVEFYREVFQW